jgi:hypothetical protein
MRSEMICKWVKVQIVGRHCQHWTQVKALDPLGVEGVEPLQIICRDARLYASPSLANAFHQRRHRGLEIDEQIRRRQGFDDQIVKLTVGPIVSQAEHLHIVQSEDTRTSAGNVDRGVDLSYNGDSLTA